MTQQKEILVSDEVRSWIGRQAGEKRVSPPVSTSDIRKWAIAIYWPDTPPPLFWDEEYARKTRFGGIVAPDDFNPFAWPVDRSLMGADDVELQEAVKRMGIGWNQLNGGGGAEYYQRIRPGDVLTSVTNLDDIYVRSGRQWPMIFLIRKTTWANQRGEVVKVSRGIGIRY